MSLLSWARRCDGARQHRLARVGDSECSPLCTLLKRVRRSFPVFPSMLEIGAQAGANSLHGCKALMGRRVAQHRSRSAANGGLDDEGNREMLPAQEGREGTRPASLPVQATRLPSLERTGRGWLELWPVALNHSFLTRVFSPTSLDQNCRIEPKAMMSSSISVPLCASDSVMVYSSVRCTNLLSG